MNHRRQAMGYGQELNEIDRVSWWRCTEKEAIHFSIARLTPVTDILVSWIDAFFEFHD
jgi:hypothetical protein